MWGKVLGKAALIWAQEQPIVQEQKRKVEERVAGLKNKTQARIAQFESEFWEWVRQLESEGYVDVPYQAGPSLAESYALLEVSAQVSDQRVRKAWRGRMLKCHPDRFAQDPDALAQAEIEARQVNEAYQVICRARGLR
jgi:DnaJ-domain-containing protein 1